MMGNPARVPVEVVDVIKHSDTISTVFMKPLQRLPRFKAGQFLHLTLEPYDPCRQWPDSRVFSIASSPTQPDILRIAYAVKGRYTKRMFDSIVKGSRLWIKLPYGQFSLSTQSSTHVLIAGGTGLTPFLSFLQQASDSKEKGTFLLYYGFKTPQYHYFQSDIDSFQANLPGFRCKIYCETSDDECLYIPGRVDIMQALKDTENLENPNFYLSGPIEMIKYCKNLLLQNNIPIDNIVVDDWE